MLVHIVHIVLAKEEINKQIQSCATFANGVLILATGVIDRKIDIERERKRFAGLQLIMVNCSNEYYVCVCV